MPTELNFAVVDQATNVARKVGGYITVGMDTTIDIAQDVVDTEKGPFTCIHTIVPIAPVRFNLCCVGC